MKRIAVLLVLAGVLSHATAASNEPINQEVKAKVAELEKLNQQMVEQLNKFKTESLKQQKALSAKINEQEQQHQQVIKTLNENISVLEKITGKY